MKISYEKFPMKNFQWKISYEKFPMKNFLWKIYLMHSQVAHVAEQNNIAVLALSVHTNAAHGILVNGRYTRVIAAGAFRLKE